MKLKPIKWENIHSPYRDIEEQYIANVLGHPVCIVKHTNQETYKAYIGDKSLIEKNNFDEVKNAVEEFFNIIINKEIME